MVVYRGGVPGGVPRQGYPGPVPPGYTTLPRLPGPGLPCPDWATLPVYYPVLGASGKPREAWNRTWDRARIARMTRRTESGQNRQNDQNDGIGPWYTLGKPGIVTFCFLPRARRRAGSPARLDAACGYHACQSGLPWASGLPGFLADSGLSGTQAARCPSSSCTCQHRSWLAAWACCLVTSLVALPRVCPGLDSGSPRPARRWAITPT